MSEQKTENKNNNNLVKIVVGVLVFALLGFLAYGFFSKDSKNPINSLVNKAKNTFEKSEDYNYAFKFNGKLEALDEEGRSMGSGSLSLGESQIYSNSNALKQRLTLKDIKVSESEREVFKVESIDIVSDYFKNYLNFESAQKSELLASLKEVQYPLAQNIASALSNTGTYVMVDNEKAVLKTIGDLSKNESIKNLFLSTGLSNPLAYLKETGTLEKLKEEVKSDKFLDYIFTNNGEATKEEGKTKQALILNDKVCVDYLPFVNNLMTQLSKIPGEVNPLGEGLKLEDCKQGLTQANSMLQFAVQAYKIGDLEKGDYDFVVSMGNVYNSKITYKSHKLSTWEIKVESPNKTDFVLDISGDENGDTNSLIKIDMSDEFSGLSVKGEIKNGNGEIKVDSKNKENGAFGSIKVKNYYLEDINIKILADSKEIGTLKGKIVKDEVNLKATFDAMEKGSFELICKDDYLKIDLNTNSVKVKLVYDDGKIDGNIDSFMDKVSLKGDYKNLADFSLKLTDENNPEKNYAVAEAKREGEIIKYTARLIEDSVARVSFDASLSKGKKEDYKTLNFVGELSSEQMNNGKLKFDLEFLYKKGGAKFEIPANFREVEISYFEMATLPAMNPVVIKEQIEMMKPYMGFMFIGFGMVGFSENYFNNSYSRDPNINGLEEFTPEDLNDIQLELEKGELDM